MFLTVKKALNHFNLFSVLERRCKILGNSNISTFVEILQSYIKYYIFWLILHNFNLLTQSEVV